MADETMKQKRHTFTEKVNAVLGDGFKYEDFVNDPELEDLQTPIYPAYADDDNGEMQVTLMPMTTPMMLIPTTSMSVPR
jgi:hypothetical protein